MHKAIAALNSRPEFKRMQTSWSALAPEVVGEALRVQAIPAPTFDEAERAAYVKARFEEMQLADVRVDDLHNVFARLPGQDPARPGVLLSAHLDTVFPADTSLTTQHDQRNGRMTGAGLGDNSLGVAAMLMLVHALQLHNILPAADLLLAATVGEEGNGDLRGMRRVFEGPGADQIGLAIVLEGIGLSRVYNAGLGVRRLRLDVRGPGGHSWLHADRPSAIHELIQIGGAVLNEVHLSEKPRATLNIGLISGGQSINTRAPEASFSIDLRAENADTLDEVEGQVRRAIEGQLLPPGMSVRLHVIGDRPCAILDPNHPLITAACAVLEYLGFGRPRVEIGSTDANIPLAAEVPAVCIGITTGGNAHTVEEYIDIAPIAPGMAQLSLLTMLALDHSIAWADWGARATVEAL